MWPDARARPHLHHRLGSRDAGAIDRRQDGSRSRCGVGGGRTAAPRRELRLRDRRRGHEDAVLHAERRWQVEAGVHAVGLQRRHRHLCRKNRAQVAGVAGEVGAGGLRRLQPAQDQLEVRHLRRGRREHPDQVRRAGGGDRRQPVRGGGLPESQHADQGQHADARRTVVRRPEPVLPRPAGSLAPSSRQAVEGTEDRCRSGQRDPGAERGGVLRLPRLHRDCRRRTGSRPLHRPGEACPVDRERTVGSEGEGWREGPGERPGRIGRLHCPVFHVGQTPWRRKSNVVLRGSRGLRLRQHDREGRGALTGARASLQLLHTIPGQSDRGREGAVPAAAASRLRENRRPRADWLRQGPAQGRDRLRPRDRRDGGARHRGPALFSGRGRDLRRRRDRRENHDPAPGHGCGLSPELAVLVGQRRVSARRCRALLGAARAIRRACVQREVGTGAGHGLRRVPAIGHRQPAAQGLVRRRDHGGPRRGAAAQRVGLCRAAAKPRRGGPQVHPAGRHAPQSRGGESPGRFHRGEGARRRDRGASLFRRSGRDRCGAVRRATAR